MIITAIYNNRFLIKTTKSTKFLYSGAVRRIIIDAIKNPILDSSDSRDFS